jgi:hypothetical protein
MALLIGGVFGFIGGALQSGSAMFIVARLLTGIGIGMLVALVFVASMVADFGF